MAMNAQQRKAKQRSTLLGYGKSRQTGWRQQGINDITYQEYLDRLEAQNHQCGICKCHINGNSALDHNHATGDPRGLLCRDCNLLLGKVENGGSAFLLNAVSYLQQWN